MWIFCMDRECECRVLVYLNIFPIRFFKFTEDYKLQLHLSRNELFRVGPVVHKGVHLSDFITMGTFTPLNYAIGDGGCYTLLILTIDSSILIPIGFTCERDVSGIAGGPNHCIC